MGRVVLICSVLLVTGVAHAQQWTSTDVGTVGLSGSAVNSAASWTMHGSGADIWGANDAFQFLHRPANRSGFIVARIANLQAANGFAKAGIMLRASVDANAATAILDVKPDGSIEFMTRAATGASMQYIDGTADHGWPVWLRLGWTSGTVIASTSTDGGRWTVLCSTEVALPLTPEAGVAVTSHDDSQLATATVDHLTIGIQRVGWDSQLVGAATSGGASELNGAWTIAGAGGDIWGAADSFEYLSRSVTGNNLHLAARVDDLQNTHPFAKAGVMLRGGLEPGAATVLIDVTPGGQVEFMARTTAGSGMVYLGGTTAPTPVWLQLSWSTGANGTTNVTGSISGDGATWTSVGTTVSLALPDMYRAGVAVTSHDATHATTAHVHGLTLLPNGWRSSEVGATSTVGNAAIDSFADDIVFTVEGAGSDIWGNSDAFHLVQLPATVPDHFSLTYRVVSLDNTNAMAKAGVMFRDSANAAAASVVLDANPDGSVEFMARLCSQCATSYLGGAHVIFPAYLSLTRDGATFTATVFTTAPGDGSTIGSVTVPMTSPIAGLAVTSHDPSRTTTAVFDNPAR
jgi:hypothetical protein